MWLSIQWKPLVVFTHILLHCSSSSSASTVHAVYYAAHSHNDYSEQKDPIWDAVDLGIGSIEADIYLVKDTLVIGHDFPTKETLIDMYIDPLVTKIDNSGEIFEAHPEQPINLLIDIKSKDAISTFEVLNNLLQTNYSKYFSMFERLDGEDDDVNRVNFKPSFINCILSGNRDFDQVVNTFPRWCSVDSNTMDDIDIYSNLVTPIVSLNFNSVFGLAIFKLNTEQIKTLTDHVKLCKETKKRLRYWGGLDSMTIWQQMLNVDEEKDVVVLNADNLDSAASLLQKNNYRDDNQNCNITPAWCSDDKEDETSTPRSSHLRKQK